MLLKPTGNETKSESGFYNGKSKTSQTTLKNNQSSKNPKKKTTTTESLESKRIESTSQIEAQTS